MIKQLLFIFFCLFLLTFENYVRADDEITTHSTRRQYPGGADEDDLQVQKGPPPQWDRFSIRDAQDQEIKSAMNPQNRNVNSDEEAGPAEQKPREPDSESAGE